jgi:AbrB family looped-hinge helix DNA binding protein
MTVTIGKAGRIVLPKPLREAMGLKEGDRLEVDRFGGELHLVHQPTRYKLTYKDGFPTLEGPADFDVVEEINRAREARADYISGVGGYDRDDL